MTLSLPDPARPSLFSLFRAVRPVLLLLLTLLDPPALAQQQHTAPVETVAPPSIHPATEPPLPDPDLSLPVPDVPSPTPSASPRLATTQSWLDRLRSDADTAEKETGAVVFKLKTDLERTRLADDVKGDVDGEYRKLRQKIRPT